MDSSPARGISQRAGPRGIRPHQTRFHWVQERVKEGTLVVAIVPGEGNGADLGTKVLDGRRVRELSERIGFREGPGGTAPVTVPLAATPWRGGGRRVARAV